MARFAVSAVVGVAVGVFAGPAAGFQAFSVAYGVTGFLDPNQRTQGPRLDDTKAPQASYGSPIPYVEGAPRLPGIFAWASEKREISTTKEVGGKGGGGVDSTTYTYEMDVLYLLSINPIAGVRRIWSYGELVWSAADDADGATLAASASTEKWRALRVYTGAADQFPDPAYEAALGAGSAPAYRGRGSVFIEGLQLGGGGQVPLLTFEIATGPGFATSIHMGGISNAEWHPWSSAIYADKLGVTMHVRQRNSAGTETRAVAIKRLNPDGTVSDVGGYETEINSKVFGAGVSDVPIGVWALPNDLVLGPGIEVHPAGSANFKLRKTSEFNILRYCFRKGVFYFATTTELATDNFLFKATGGNISATSPQLSGDVQSVAATDTHIYVFLRNGTQVLRYSATDLAFVDTIALPFSGVSTGTLLLLSNPSNVVYMLTIDTLYLFNGTWQTVSTNFGLAGAEAQDGGLILSVHALDGDTIYTARLQGANNPAGAQVYRLGGTFAADPVPLDKVVSRLCLRTGLLQPSDIDVTALAGRFVRAMAVAQITPTRSVLENLMQAYHFEAVEGAKIKFVLRGGAAALTIPFKDLGAYAGGEPPEPLQLIRRNDIELPAFVTVKYANVLNDFQDSSESSDRLTTNSTSVALVEIPLGLTPEEAKRIADVTAMDLAVSVLGLGPVALDNRYAALEPTDVVLLTAESGSTYRARLVTSTDSQGLRTLDPVIDDATIINSAALTDAGYTGSTIVRAIGATVLHLLDVPIFRDVDNQPGFYAAAGATGKWPGATLRRSKDGINYGDEAATFSDRAVVGSTTGVLGDWDGGYKFDEVNSITVDVGGGVLSSSTREAMQLDASINLLSIGLPGKEEIIQFRNATLQSQGVYTLSGLLRGRRGTEALIKGHASAEPVVLIRSTGLRRITHPSTDIGLSRQYKAVTFGTSLGSATAKVFADSGRALKPFNPTNARAARNASGDITLTWDRRTRLAVRYGGAGGSFTPLGEGAESYSIDVYANSSFMTVIRTLTSTVKTVQYTSAQQVADFGANQAAVHFGVHQLSAIVGRGTELRATI